MATNNREGSLYGQGADIIQVDGRPQTHDGTIGELQLATRHVQPAKDEDVGDVHARGTHGEHYRWLLSERRRDGRARLAHNPNL
eukprot:6320390-Prymnesium_polylepis.1